MTTAVKKIVWSVAVIFMLMIVAFVGYDFITSESVIVPIASALNAPSLCERITAPIFLDSNGPIVNCYASVAIAHKDISICNGISADGDKARLVSGKLRSACYSSYAVSFRDASVCDNPNNLNKDICYLGYSQIIKDAGTCVHIQNIEQQTFCYEYYRKDDVCFGIKDANEKLQCFKQEAGL